jgi:hypothetical protein
MGTILGTVQTTQEEPVAEAAIMVASGPTHHDVAALSDENGEFRLSDLEPGRYVLQVNAEGFQSVRGNVDVRAEGIARVRITLSAEAVPEIE